MAWASCAAARAASAAARASCASASAPLPRRHLLLSERHIPATGTTGVGLRDLGCERCQLCREPSRAVRGLRVSCDRDGMCTSCIGCLQFGEVCDPGSLVACPGSLLGGGIRLCQRRRGLVTCRPQGSQLALGRQRRSGCVVFGLQRRQLRRQPFQCCGCRLVFPCELSGPVAQRVLGSDGHGVGRTCRRQPGLGVLQRQQRGLLPLRGRIPQGAVGGKFRLQRRQCLVGVGKPRGCGLGVGHRSRQPRPGLDQFRVRRAAPRTPASRRRCGSAPGLCAPWPPPRAAWGVPVRLHVPQWSRLRRAVRPTGAPLRFRHLRRAPAAPPTARAHAAGPASRPPPRAARRRLPGSGRACLDCTSSSESRPSSCRRRSSARARLASVARNFSSASCRRACRPVMPAASSRIERRSSGRAPTRAETRPWLTMAEERAPLARSANRVCTSRARISRPLTR